VSALKAAQRAAIDKLIGRAVHDPTTSVARLDVPVLKRAARTAGVSATFTRKRRRALAKPEKGKGAKDFRSPAACGTNAACA
jgi:hypothetical protein